MTAVYAGNPQALSPLANPPRHQYISHDPQPITPPSSSEGTPGQASPMLPNSAWKSPNFALHQPQLGPRRQPMGIPAVLRQTEKPNRYSPPKNGPRTAYGSPDSMHFEGNKFGQIPQPNAPIMGLSRIVTEEWNDEILGKVTGAPSRNHWKPDTTALQCDQMICDRYFSFFERRHHCRRCGNIFCWAHSSREAPLDQHARFHPQGVRNRVCDACHGDFQKWHGARLSRTNSNTSSSTASGAMTPTVNIAAAGQQPNVQDGAFKVGSVAQSVPKDWNWSTF